MPVDAISAPTGIQYGQYGTAGMKKPGEEPEDGTKAVDTKEDLTREEKSEVDKLEKRDREVRAHEMAHVAAGGQYVRGGASFDYQTGPDNKRYAVGGEVSIDTSPEKDPQATIQKMQVVRKAALAPAKPSAQDRSVAAQASRAESKARMELREVQKEQSEQAGEKKAEEEDGGTAPSSEPMVSYTRYGTAVPAQPVPTTPALDLVA